MNLTTDILVYHDWDDKAVNFRAEKLFNEIKTFAKMSDFGFWTECLHCIIVYSFGGKPENASQIDNIQLEKSIMEWCHEVAESCRDDPDEGSDGYEFKKFTVEISDLKYHGGLSIVCYDKDNDEDMGIHVLPIREEDVEDSHHYDDEDDDEG